VQENLTERVRAAGRALGFDAVGIAPAEPPPHADFLREWLARGYAGEMAWLGRRAAEREDPRRVLPGARSAVLVGVVYDPGAEAMPSAGGRIARYAGGRDYHEVQMDDVAAAGWSLVGPRAGPAAARGHPTHRSSSRAWRRTSRRPCGPSGRGGSRTDETGRDSDQHRAGAGR
jgi:hypothetical protein